MAATTLEAKAKADLQAIFARSGESATVTSRSFSQNWLTGVRTASDTDVSCKAVRTVYDVQDVHASGGTIEIGDTRIFLRCAEVTDRPTRDVQVTIGDDVFDVVSVRKGPFGVYWDVQARQKEH